ncbi:MarR family winged helix-turn-helix transcriptional regulator [Cellulomonas fimi]|uniref:MarR family winged helix-turn-helix transcriptional regulator n=1 Tax=Cellulomonas fimi TaxID=1708 RepID=UPI00289360EA|nr:MarR family winged helix-turn-helix transcriptional regulator [Cellulomonas fimi]
MPDDVRRWPTGRLLSSAARQVERDWNAHLAAWDLNHASLPVLVLLAHRDHSQRELATATSVTEQTMSRVLARMERTGYVTRRPHGDDRRRHVISLTALGAEVMREAADPAPAEALSTRGLGPEQVEQLRELLALMVIAGQSPPRPGQLP